MKALLKTTLFILLNLTLTLSNVTQSFAHGENKKGPHSGYIRMPGAFHTEVVPTGKHQLKVYLLDIDWKNPSILNSKLIVSYSQKSPIVAQCKAVENAYHCIFPNSVRLDQKGILEVTAERESQKGIMVHYPLPFKIENEHKEQMH